MFIVFDGIDGAGKSTQIALLGEYLTRIGREWVTFRDPGTTKLGEEIRSILLHKEEIPLAMPSEMLLYMAARAQLVAEQIKPALEKGVTVICDRFLLANVVYQGCAGGLEADSIWEVGRIATQGLVPDVTVVLDLTVDEAKRRAESTGRGLDRLEKRGEDYFKRVREGFLTELPRAGKRGWVVDAGGSPSDVHRKILDCLGQEQDLCLS